MGRIQADEARRRQTGGTIDDRILFFLSHFCFNIPHSSTTKSGLIQLLLHFDILCLDGRPSIRSDVGPIEPFSAHEDSFDGERNILWVAELLVWVCLLHRVDNVARFSSGEEVGVGWSWTDDRRGDATRCERLVF